MNDTILTMLDHIGRMNVLAISGGRVNYSNNNSYVELPVRQGYKVRITHNRVPDTYTVERILQRGCNPEKLKGIMDGVYAEQLGDTAYRASCYSDKWGN